MNLENQLKILSKTFEDKKVRTMWNQNEEKYYISVVDIIIALTDSEYQSARNYWEVTKTRLKKEMSRLQIVTN